MKKKHGLFERRGSGSRRVTLDGRRAQPLTTRLRFEALESRAMLSVTINTVPVGNVGNGNDPATGSLYGGVGYAYNIGTTEVTVAQYAVFLNAVAATDTYALYNTLMGTDLNVAGISRSGVSGNYHYSVIGSPSHPVTYVSWGDAARFSNWLHNGQPIGAQNASTTENGTYTLNGAITTAALNAVTRNAGARWFIPSENEWYKAAYHQAAAHGGDGDDYWAYPTRTNSTPYSDQPPGSGAPTQSNTANFRRNDGIVNGYNDGFAVTGSTSFSESQNYLTDVGAYTSSTSPYGTFDQGGNAMEWTEDFQSGSFRLARGGASSEFSGTLLSSNREYGADPALADVVFGFRVASITTTATGDLINESFDSNSAYTSLGQARTTNGELILTDGLHQNSAVWFTAPIGRDTLTATFDFRIDTSQGLGWGDGFTFAVINPAVDPIGSTLGAGGGSLGYAGSNSAAVNSGFAIEFDTFRNHEFQDLSYQHVGLDLAGSVQSSVVSAPLPFDVTGASLVHAQVTFNTGQVNVFLTADGFPSKRVLSTSLPPGAFPNIANVGFTGATWDAGQRVRIDNFRLFHDSPPSPTGLIAIPKGSTAIQLAWNRVITTGDYFVDRATTASGPFQQIAIRSAGQPQYIDQGLSPSTTYFYRVRSVKAGVSSLDSAVAAATTTSAATFDSGPRILTPANLGTRAQGVNFVDVTFSESISGASFTSADVTLRRGTAIIPVQQPIHQGSNVWRIPFVAQSTPSSYNLLIGPNILDLAGKPMNQDNDTFNGEASADRFVGIFSITQQPPPSTTRIRNLDRWWGYSGDQFTVNLEVDIATAGNYSLDVDVDDAVGTDWELAAGSYVTVGDDSTQRSFSFLAGAVASLGTLSAGHYVLHIHEFVAPDRYTIQNVTFELDGPGSEDDQFVASFISDRRGLSSTAANGLTFEDGFGHGMPIGGLQDLTERFAPTFYFGADEHFPQPFPVQSTIAGSIAKDGTSTPIVGDIRFIGDTEALLDLPVTSSFPAGPFIPTIYAAVVPDLPNNRLAINYWFHYPYNDWKDRQDDLALKARGAGNNHEGDWEGITVLFTRDGMGNPFRPIFAVYSQHERVVRIGISLSEGRQVVPWESAVSDNSTSPKAFVAVGSHATYPIAGRTRIGTSRWTSGYDVHRGDGASIEPASMGYDVVTIGRAPELAGTDKAWALFPGRWGEMDLEGGRLEIRDPSAPLISFPTDDGGDDGPIGPLFQGLGFAPGMRWYDPWAWAGDPSDVSSLALNQAASADSDTRNRVAIASFQWPLDERGPELSSSLWNHNVATKGETLAFGSTHPATQLTTSERTPPRDLGRSIARTTPKEDVFVDTRRAKSRQSLRGDLVDAAVDDMHNSATLECRKP